MTTENTEKENVPKWEASLNREINSFYFGNFTTLLAIVVGQPWPAGKQAPITHARIPLPGTGREWEEKSKTI